MRRDQLLQLVLLALDHRRLAAHLMPVGHGEEVKLRQRIGVEVMGLLPPLRERDQHARLCGLQEDLGVPQPVRTLSLLKSHEPRVQFLLRRRLR